MIDAIGIDVFFALCGLGIVLSLAVPERCSPLIVAIVGAIASAILCLAAADALLTRQVLAAQLGTSTLGTAVRVGLDPLSAVFLLAAAVVFLATSVFSAGYLKRYLGEYSLRAFAALYFGVLAAIAAVLVARDVVSFLIAWELMSIGSYLLVNFEHRQEQNIRAGYLMLAMGEAGALAAAIALLLLANPAGSFSFKAIAMAAGRLGGGARWAVFLLSLLGFGVKAGLVPVNSWLPRAHPVAPANVSALLSGVILNLGIYGIVRVNIGLLPVTLAGTGIVALLLGAISAFLGILYAITSNDTKTLLAHSSIENMGIVITALGAGFVFTTSGHPDLAAIAFVAALYHMVNHSIYKALLFLGAGTIDARAGTRDLDRLGGLIHAMPWTALFFLIGALSISAIYPFGGFSSEWLTLQALLRSVVLASHAIKAVFAFCGVALALTAALAVTCFVKAFAMGFLGMPRSDAAAKAREAPVSMLAPMGALALLTVLLGILPTFVIPALSGALEPLTGASATEALVPPFFARSGQPQGLPADFIADFHPLGAQIGQGIIPGRGLVVLHRGDVENPVVFAMSTSYGIVVLVLLLAGAVLVVWRLTANRSVTRDAQWDGGVRRLLPEMTYTATGFSNPVRVIFDAVLRPRTVEDTQETVAQHFRVAIVRSKEEIHLVDRWVLDLLAAWMAQAASLLARIHHGRINAYVAYVLGTLVAFLIIADALR
jgi:hydrogenase-4 component B